MDGYYYLLGCNSSREANPNFFLISSNLFFLKAGIFQYLILCFSLIVRIISTQSNALLVIIFLLYNIFWMNF